MEIPGIEEQSKSEKWFSERWCRLTASKCLSACKVGKLVIECQPNAATEASKFIFTHIWKLESEHLQTYWMRYALESEPKAILKYESVRNVKVFPSALWVNPKFPFLRCSLDGLVRSDTIVEIKSLKIFKQYSVKTVTSPTSPVAKSVLSRQCFQVEDGKCILKHSHAYYYQCQQILLVTGRQYCDFILHTASVPDSVERIPRDEPLTVEILSYLTALWRRVIAQEIFEMRVPRDLVPFVSAEAAETLDSFERPSVSPDSYLEFGDPTTCISSASPAGSLEPNAPTASPDRCLEGENPTTYTPSASPVGSLEPDAPPASPDRCLEGENPVNMYFFSIIWSSQ